MTLKFFICCSVVSSSPFNKCQVSIKWIPRVSDAINMLPQACSFTDTFTTMSKLSSCHLVVIYFPLRYRQYQIEEFVFTVGSQIHISKNYSQMSKEKVLLAMIFRIHTCAPLYYCKETLCLSLHIRTEVFGGCCKIVCLMEIGRGTRQWHSFGFSQLFCFRKRLLFLPLEKK